MSTTVDTRQPHSLRPGGGRPPPWGADPGYDSTYRPPDPHAAPPPAGYPAPPRQPGDQSTARHAQPPGPSYQHAAGNADAYSGSQRGTRTQLRGTCPPAASGALRAARWFAASRADQTADLAVGTSRWLSGRAGSAVPAPPAARPGSFGGPGQRHESVGAMQSQVREADFVTPYKQVPERGWRRKVYQTTRINLGLSPAEREWNDLRRRLTVNLRVRTRSRYCNRRWGVQDHHHRRHRGRWRVTATTRWWPSMPIQPAATSPNGSMSRARERGAGC